MGLFQCLSLWRVDWGECNYWILSSMARGWEFGFLALYDLENFKKKVKKQKKNKENIYSFCKMPFVLCDA